MLSGTECPGQTRGFCWVLRTPGRLSCKSSSKIAFSEQAFPLSSSSDFPSGTRFRICASEYVCPSFTPFADTERPGYSRLSPTASCQMTQLDFFQTHWGVPASVPCLPLTSRSTAAGTPGLMCSPCPEESLRNHSSPPRLVPDHWSRTEASHCDGGASGQMPPVLEAEASFDKHDHLLIYGL